MAKVLANKAVSADFYLMEVEEADKDSAAREGRTAKMGQFYMLRAWDTEPVLSRPISVYDAEGRAVSFLYKTVGRGTEMFSRLKPGDTVTLLGPLGNGFPAVSGRVALVGGGAGIAPFYLGAKQLKAAGCRVEVFLGFSGKAFLVPEYKKVADTVTINEGGFITDSVDPERYDYIFTCGPEIMMRVLWDKCKSAGAGDRLFVSLESRMACGLGACYGCSRITTKGSKKVCKDGPVFPAAEIFGEGGA